MDSTMIIESRVSDAPENENGSRSRSVGLPEESSIEGDDEDAIDINARSSASPDLKLGSSGCDSTNLRPMSASSRPSSSRSRTSLQFVDCALPLVSCTPSSPSQSSRAHSLTSPTNTHLKPASLSTTMSSDSCGRSGSSPSLPPVTCGRRFQGALSRSTMGHVSLTITVTARFKEAKIAIELDGSNAHQVGELPAQLPFEVPAIAEIRGTGSILGALYVAGVPPIPFGVQVGLVRHNGERPNFVSNDPSRQRTVVRHAEDLQAGNGFSVNGEGTVVEVSISDGYEAEMTVIIRRAKKKELTSMAQQTALQNAMEKGKYSSLLAQITKSKNRKVEMQLIDQAERLLKSISMPEGSYLNHKELAKLMRWKRITIDGDYTTVVDCESSSDCPCNAGHAEKGEICSVTENVVQEALDGVAPAGVLADKWLFQALVRVASSVPEGCVWKSGGKFLLTNEERNQSPTAIVNLLERNNQDSDASKGIRALVDYTEKEYEFRVTAIQINFHPNEKSSHKQHRDIYGAGQKGGINCTCSFMKCQGTVCYSVGSSRQILTESMTDSRSKYEKCCEECTGRKVYRWLHSGSANYFNDKWNSNHTHGIPQMTQACGPRISIALLCA